MKVCIFLSDITKVGGIERVISTLVNQFVSYPYLIIEIVSIFKGRENPNYPIPSNVKINYITYKNHGVKPHSIKRFFVMFSNLLKVRRFFKNHDYDIVLAQSFPPALLMFLSGFPCRKIVAVEHVYAGYYNTLVQLIRDFVYSRLRKVVVLTNADKKFFANRIRDELVEVIPNPVKQLQTHYSNLDNPRIIAIGRLVYQKGFENLIEGFTKIHEKHPEWRLDIFGDGPMRGELQLLIDKLQLSEKVHLVGVSNKITDELCQSSIFVLSSRFEGFPMVLIEALSMGVPCVAYDCHNGPSDIVKNGYNGYLIENQNLDSLIKMLEKLIIDKDLRKEMGVNAPKSVICFSDEIIAKKWIFLFKEFAN